MDPSSWKKSLIGISLKIITNLERISSSPAMNEDDEVDKPCFTPVLTSMGVEWNISFEERACKASKKGIKRCTFKKQRR